MPWYRLIVLISVLPFKFNRPYNENDRINPKSQLDPTSGKSIEYMEANNSNKKDS